MAASGASADAVRAARDADLRRRKSTQGGQALVLGLLLTGLVAIAFLQYHGVSRVAAAKVRQLHALDAASHSGALVQARALNMLATLNRAQLGHQVVMAHLTALGAWAGLGETQARQLMSVNPPPHLIAMLFGPVHGQAYAAAAGAVAFAGMTQPGGALAAAHAAHDHLVHAVLQQVQRRIVEGLPQARRQAMLAVLARSYDLPEGVGIDLDIREDDWLERIVWHDARQTYAPFLRRVAADEGFLQPRDRTARNTWAVSSRCPWLRHQLRRRGQTLLDADGQWQSTDTLSFHALRSNRWIGCYYREYPMGWAWVPEGDEAQFGQPHVDNPPENFADQDFWRWVREHAGWDIQAGNANPLANSRARAGATRWSGLGLGTHPDIAGTQRLQGIGFQSTLRMPGPDGRIVTAHSAAETYYVLPPAQRGDGKTSAAHLFLPYWQARLTAARPRQRRAAVRHGALTGTLAGVFPGALPRVFPSVLSSVLSSVPSTGPLRVPGKTQSGQALAEGLLVMLCMLLLWAAAVWLGQLQDMAQQASHASRALAFQASTAHDAIDQPSLAAVYAHGREGQWRTLAGEALIDDAPRQPQFFLDRSTVLLLQAQPGGAHAQARQLRDEWRFADGGMFDAGVSIAPSILPRLGFASNPLTIHRHTAILQGAAHSASDAAAQQRIAESALGWSDTAGRSRQLNEQVRAVMRQVDRPWGRPLPSGDWLTPWTGRVPDYATQQGKSMVAPQRQAMAVPVPAGLGLSRHAADIPTGTLADSPQEADHE